MSILEAKRKGSNLIVADSKETKLTRHSSQWLGIKQGTAIALLNGMMKIIIDKGLFDREKASKVSGFSSLESALKDYTPDKVSKITGIAAEGLVSVAEIFAKAKSRMLSLSIGISENTKGLDTVLAAANLITLMGDSPDSLQIPAEYSNTFGIYQASARPAMEMPSGKDILEMLYNPGSLRALYIMGEDPVVTFPHNSKIIRGLKSLDLLIVQDIAFTETAKLAHVVLPASSWAEKDGTFTNAEGITQRLHKVVDSTGQSLPDWLIIRNLSWAMGKDIGTRGLDGISEEIKSLPGLQPPSSNSRPCFNPVHYSYGEEPDTDYPMAMVTRDILQHSGSMSTRSKSLDVVVSEGLLGINDEDAKKLGILDNSHVKVTSKRGTVYLKAKVTDTIPVGTVYVPVHFPHGRVNALTHYSANGGISIDAVRVESAKG